MMKAILMAGAAVIATPVLAQEMPSSPQTEANTGAASVTTPEAQKGMASQAPAASTETAATEPTDATSDPTEEPAQPAARASASADSPAMNAPAQAAPAQSAATAPATTAPAAPAQSASTAPLTTAAPSQAPAQSAATTPAPAAPAQAPAHTATAEPATTTQPASTGDQVAQIVNSEFPSYDKDSTSSLSKAEFGSWMVALRSASDPSANASSPEMQTWVAQAFTSADANKDGNVSKDELTSFLSQGKS